MVTHSLVVVPCQLISVSCPLARHLASDVLQFVSCEPIRPSHLLGLRWPSSHVFMSASLAHLFSSRGSPDNVWEQPQKQHVGLPQSQSVVL